MASKPGVLPTKLVVNVVRTKKLTNMRASGTDEKLNIAPADADKIDLQPCFRMKALLRDEKRQVVKIARRIPGANRLGIAELRSNDNR